MKYTPQPIISLEDMLTGRGMTQDTSKFGQMAGEASTAISLFRNIGEYVKIGKFPKDTKCILCDKKATQAEHLVNKAHGGNHTDANVIPVCSDHTKKSGKITWKEHYKDHLPLIESIAGTDDSKRLNPFHERNKADAEDLRNLIKDTVLKFRNERGLI